MIARITKNRPEAQAPLAAKGTGAPKIVYSHVAVSVVLLQRVLEGDSDRRVTPIPSRDVKGIDEIIQNTCKNAPPMETEEVNYRHFMIYISLLRQNFRYSSSAVPGMRGEFIDSH